PSTPFIAKTMFIRVAMSDAVATPSFRLKADTGDAVLLTNLTQSIYRLPGSDLSAYVADGLVAAEANNVYRITVTFNDIAGAFAWQLGIANNDAVTAAKFTFVVSSALAETVQPWIDVVPASLSWTVLVNGSKADSVQVRNRGTGP